MTADQIARLDREARGCASRDVYPAKRHTAKPDETMVSLAGVLSALRDYRPTFLGIRESHSPWTGAAAFLERQHNEGALR
jgi:hypothetical protein